MMPSSEQDQLWADPKMLRETLCIAQNLILSDSARQGRAQHGARLQRLIDECDRRRPLGVDGKHGSRHTANCGCEEAMTTDQHVWIEAVVRRVQTSPRLPAYFVLDVTPADGGHGTVMTLSADRVRWRSMPNETGAKPDWHLSAVELEHKVSQLELDLAQVLEERDELVVDNNEMASMLGRRDDNAMAHRAAQVKLMKHLSMGMDSAPGEVADQAIRVIDDALADVETLKRHELKRLANGLIDRGIAVGADSARDALGVIDALRAELGEARRQRDDYARQLASERKGCETAIAERDEARRQRDVATRELHALIEAVREIDKEQTRAQALAAVLGQEPAQTPGSGE